MKPLSAFYDLLLPQLPGCTPALLDIELRAVLVEICEHGKLWREDFPSISTEAGVSTYALFASSPRVSVGGILAMSCGDDLWWSSEDADLSPWWANRTMRPRFAVRRPPFSVDTEGELITFDPIPTQAVTLHGWVVPDATVSSVPDWLYAQHREVVRNGVLSRLLRMSKKPWTDPLRATDCESEYTQRLHAAASRAAAKNTGRPLRTRPTPI